LPQTLAALDNSAVARCCDAYARVFQEVTASGKGVIGATIAADKAYRNAMPAPSGPDKIRDFIACVAQGMLINAIKGTQRDPAPLCRPGRQQRAPQPGRYAKARLTLTRRTPCPRGSILLSFAFLRGH